MGSYKVKIVKRPIFITSLTDSFSSLVLFTLFILFLAILPQALKIAFYSSLISLITTTANKLLCIYCVT